MPSGSRPQEGEGLCFVFSHVPVFPTWKMNTPHFEGRETSGSPAAPRGVAKSFVLPSMQVQRHLLWGQALGPSGSIKGPLFSTK